MLERTLTLIKPDHIDRTDEILAELDQDGKRIATVTVDSVPREVIEDHYVPHKNKPFFGYMTDSFVGRPVIIALYEGEGVIQKFIDLIGPTDPSQAADHTIRGKYSNDSLEKAIAEQRPVQNVIHRSDSHEEAQREIEVWEHYLNE